MYRHKGWYQFKFGRLYQLDCHIQNGVTAMDGCIGQGNGTCGSGEIKGFTMDNHIFTLAYYGSYIGPCHRVV